jgi:hypothetical protein
VFDLRNHTGEIAQAVCVPGAAVAGSLEGGDALWLELALDELQLVTAEGFPDLFDAGGAGHNQGAVRWDRPGPAATHPVVRLWCWP